MSKNSVLLSSFTGKSDAFPLDPHCALALVCNSPTACLLHAVNAATGEIEFIRYLAPGLSRFKLRGYVEGHFECPDKKAPVRIDGYIRPIEEGEPFNHEEPPPPKEPANIFQEIRMRVQREMGVNREAFLTTGMPSYELSDDDPGLFEEEYNPDPADTAYPERGDTADEPSAGDGAGPSEESDEAPEPPAST